MAKDNKAKNSKSKNKKSEDKSGENMSHKEKTRTIDSDSAKNPITVLSLNPSVDISYEVDQLVTNKKIRATKTHYYPGGNGINVARSLNELNLPCSCYNIIAGEIGNLLIHLLGDKFGDSHHHFSIDGETRLNAVLQERSPQGQYEIDSHGPEIPKSTIKQVLDAFVHSSKNTIAVLTGSLPPGVDKTVYQMLTDKLIKRGCKVIVDANGEELHHVMKSKPYLLRLNRFVLESIVKRRLEQVEDIAAAAREIQLKGANNVFVTLGYQGALLVTQKNSLFANAPKTCLKSTVGCGDSTISGMIYAIHQNKTPEEMLRFGIICGSATASHPGTELFSQSEVIREYDDIEVISLDI